MKVWKIPCNSEFEITYPFGVYDENLNWYNSDKRHHGTDIYISDRKVISAYPGRVEFAGWNDQGYGNLVIVRNGDYQFYYAHLESINVCYGEEVSFLTQIGVQGATGNVTGEHLHFEVRFRGSVINSSEFMGVPNEYGNYYPENYAFDYGNDAPNIDFKYNVGQLVVYSHYYDDSYSKFRHSCFDELGSFMQDYIASCENTTNYYVLNNGRHLRNEDIVEVK